MKKIDTLPQDKLLLQLRNAIDEARISDPLKGTDQAARRRVRRLIRENPRSIRSSHVWQNLGKARREWVEPLIELELA